MSNAILLGIGLIDNTAKDLARISKNLRANGRNLASVGSELTQGITFPVVAAGAALLKFSGDLDAMKKALAANMGGMAQANAEFEKLKELAKAPGIGLEEAIKGSYRLQGLGESADEARHQMENFAKVVSLSGGGEAQFGGLLQQFTQMKGVGKILGGDIRFMIENAPVLGKVLNDAFGTANPEKLRDMGITVDQLIEGMMREMDKLKGIGGSVKNTLENLWTSIRIGGGEIGLAILGATGFGNTLEDLSANIDKAATSAAKWIRENQGIVQNIGKLIAVMAVTGPIARFIGNISMIGGLLFGIPAKIATIIRSLVLLDKTTKLMSLSWKGWGVVAVATIIGVAEALNALDKPMNDFWKRLTNRPTTVNDEYQRRLAEFEAKNRENNKIVTPDAKVSAFNLISSLNVGTRSRKNMWQGTGKEASTPKPPTPPTDDELKVAQDAFEARIKLQREMEQMFKESPVKSRLDSFPEQRGFDELDNKKISPNQVPVKQSDTKVLEEYAAALREVSMEQKMGLSPMDAMKMKVDAAAAAYRSMIDLYGETSSQAAEAFNTWKTASNELATATEEHNKQIEKQAMLMDYVNTAVNGVTDALTSLITDGSKGMEEFGKSILKLATNLLKMAIAQFISSAISTLGLFGAPAAIGGAAALGGSAAGLIGKISLADGGLLTGETMVRAGEYPGVKADPEVISPVSKIQKYIREAIGNGNGGGGESVIWGDHILIAASRAQGRGIRRGSGNVITF